MNNLKWLIGRIFSIKSWMLFWNVFLSFLLGILFYKNLGNWLSWFDLLLVVVVWVINYFAYIDHTTDTQIESYFKGYISGLKDQEGNDSK